MNELYPSSKSANAVPRATPEPWVDIALAAQHLGVKKSWLYARGDELGVPCRRLGNARRYKISLLDEYMQAAAQ